MTDKLAFRLDDHPLAEEPFDYRMCGLDNVILLNGFTRHETAYGPGVSIDAADELERAIAQHLVTRQGLMNGRELRFLRKQMDLTQDELAGLLGVNPQTVARYEKEQSAVTGPVDGLMRMIFATSMSSKRDALRLLDRFRAIRRRPRRRAATAGPPARWHQAA